MLHSLDTNIVFPLVVKTDNSERANKLVALDPDWRTESLAMIEICNILSTYERQKLLSAAEARKALGHFEELLDGRIMTVPNQTALDIAFQYRITIYDAKFLALSIMNSVPLVTEDRKLRNAAPQLTQSLEVAIASLR